MNTHVAANQFTYEGFHQRAVEIMGRLTLPFGWQGLLVETSKHTHYLQVSDPKAIDNVTGETISWRGRKWLLSEHMTDGEIVQTAFKAVMTAMEHEVRELFLYRGQPIFDPHYDIEKLVELRAQPDALKEREPVT